MNDFTKVTEKNTVGPVAYERLVELDILEDPEDEREGMSQAGLVTDTNRSS